MSIMTSSPPKALAVTPSDASAASSLLALVDAASRLAPVEIPSVTDDDSSSTTSSTESISSHSAKDAEQPPPAASIAVPSPRYYRRPASHLFPVVLMSLLLDESTDDILSLSPDRSTFMIHSHSLFAKPNGIMVQHFHLVKFDTFLRKTHEWGFVRLPARDSHDLTFMHPSGLFDPNDLSKCRKIKRTRSSPNPRSVSPADVASSPTSILRNPSVRTAQSVLVEKNIVALRLRRRYEMLARSARMSVLRQKSVASASAMNYSDFEVKFATKNVLGAALQVLDRDQRMNAPSISLR
jgi:hypothetical protein